MLDIAAKADSEEDYGYTTYYNGDDETNNIVPANTAAVVYGKLGQAVAKVVYTDDISTKYAPEDDASGR